MIFLISFENKKKMFRVENIKTKEVFYFMDDQVLDRLKKIYKNDNITESDFMITKNECFGCNNDKLDQLSHMVCDTGCLHDPRFCENCS